MYIILTGFKYIVMRPVPRHEPKKSILSNGPSLQTGSKASSQEVFTYKIAFFKGTFILRCIDSKGKITQQALLDEPNDMFAIKTKDGVNHVQDGDVLRECKFFFMSKDKGLLGHVFCIHMFFFPERELCNCWLKLCSYMCMSNTGCCTCLSFTFHNYISSDIKRIYCSYIQKDIYPERLVSSVGIFKWPWRPSQHSWEIKIDSYKYELLKFNAKKEILETVFLPDPKDKYMIDNDSSGVAMLKDGDTVVKSCQDVVDESSTDVAKGLFVRNNVN